MKLLEAVHTNVSGTKGSYRFEQQNGKQEQPEATPANASPYRHIITKVLLELMRHLRSPRRSSLRDFDRFLKQ